MLSVLVPATSHSVRLDEGNGIVGILFRPIKGLLLAEGIFSSRFFGNLKADKKLLSYVLYKMYVP